VVFGLVAARPDSSAERLHDPRRTPWHDTPLAKIFAGTPEFASPEHEMPAHHEIEETIDEHLSKASIDKGQSLFQSVNKAGTALTGF